MEVKDDRKRAAEQIKRIVTSNAVPVNYDSDEYVRVTHNKMSRTGVIPSHQHQYKKTHKQHEVHCYCVP